ncbi:porin family protein [candidate division KSB1 bacterium]|nr:porin family protein [candidate division KSB1 bacterium]
MMRLGLFFAILLLLSSFDPGLAEEKYFSRGSIGLQYGLYKPSSLDSDPADLLKRIEGASDALGFFIVSPSWNGIALRLQAFQWRYDDPPHSVFGEKITIRHLAAEIKQQILSTTTISPYVTFGLAWIGGCHEQDDSDSCTNQSRTNGLDVGAGIDLQVVSHLSLALEYQYLYVKFDRLVGPTDDYSGSFVTLRLAYLF